MTLAAELEQDVPQRCSGPQRRLGFDTEPLGQLIRGLEADAANVLSQAVWIGAHDLDRLLAIGFVDSDGAVAADAVALQEDDDVAHDLLLLPARADLGDAARANAFDFLEKHRTFVNDVEGPGPEDFDDPVSELRSDTLDQSGRQVFLDALRGAGGDGAQAVGFELRAVLGVLFPLAGRF